VTAISLSGARRRGKTIDPPDAAVLPEQTAIAPVTERSQANPELPDSRSHRSARSRSWARASDQVLDLDVFFSVGFADFAQTRNGVDGVEPLEVWVVLEDLHHLFFLVGAVVAHVAEPAPAPKRAYKVLNQQIPNLNIEILSLQPFREDAVAKAAAEVILLPVGRV